MTELVVSVMVMAWGRPWRLDWPLLSGGVRMGGWLGTWGGGWELVIGDGLTVIPYLAVAVEGAVTMSTGTQVVRDVVRRRAALLWTY